MQRMPSSLRSKIQSGSLKRLSVSTAFIAPAVVGAALIVACARSPSSSSRSTRRAWSSSVMCQVAPTALRTSSAVTSARSVPACDAGGEQRGDGVEHLRRG